MVKPIRPQAAQSTPVIAGRRRATRALEATLFSIFALCALLSMAAGCGHKPGGFRRTTAHTSRSEPQVTEARPARDRALDAYADQKFQNGHRRKQHLSEAMERIWSDVTSDALELRGLRAVVDQTKGDGGGLGRLRSPILGNFDRPEVRTKVDYYLNQTSGRRVLVALAQRGERFRPRIELALEAARLPPQLYYVAMAESGFDIEARSSAGAVGLWQFTTATAQSQGLAVNAYIDERQDVARSTQAAVAYLGTLHARYGNWELALAAYNMGPTALDRSISKYNTNDFWKLAVTEAGLPNETVDYVAKIIAFEFLGENLLDLKLITPESSIDSHVAVLVDRSVTLAWMAKAGGCNAAALVAANPSLRRRRTPRGGAWVNVPASCASGRYWERFEKRDAGASYPFARFRAVQGRVYALGEDSVFHRLISGESAAAELGRLVALPRVSPPANVDEQLLLLHGDGSLARLADALGTTVPWLLTANPQLDPRSRLRSGLVVRFWHTGGRPQPPAVAAVQTGVQLFVTNDYSDMLGAYESTKGRQRKTYVARPGDTLATVAKRFGVSTGDLARINGLARNTVFSGNETLVVYVDKRQ